MAQKRIVLVYATTWGQTAKIMNRLAAELQSRGANVQMNDVRSIQPPPLAGADAVVVGGSLIYGKFQPELVAFAKQFAVRLQKAGAIFMPVSMSAARDNPGAQAEVQKSVARFAELSGWTPAKSVPMGGALRWTQYGFFTKMMLLLVMKMLKAPETDTSRDYELTDWSKVDALADELAGARTVPAVARSEVPRQQI